MIDISYIALAVTAVLVGIDQFLKFIVQVNIGPYDSVPVLPGLLGFTHAENTGAAFNSFDGQTGFLIGLTGIICLALLLLLVFRKFKNKVFIWHAAVILAGGLGNLVDRIFRGGKVIDYIELKFINFAIFNFADCLTVLGVISLLVYLLFFDRSEYFSKESTDKFFAAVKSNRVYRFIDDSAFSKKVRKSVSSDRSKTFHADSLRKKTSERKPKE